MTTDSPWHSRWRSESHYQGHYYFDQGQTPQPPAPGIGNLTSPSLPSSVDNYSRPWDGKSRGDSETYPRGVTSTIDRYADPPTYHSRLLGRHTSPGRDSSLNNSPPRQDSSQPWHSLPVDHHSQNRHITDAPLTLHIPQTQDLSKVSRTYPPNSNHPLESQGSHSQQSTTLPSFASFSEHASRTDDPDEVEIAPMSARLPCNSCNRLAPLIREVALAVAELDDNVQQYCNKSATRTLDFPKDNPIQATQWILERLAKTKTDLQDTARRMQSQPPTSVTGMHSRNVSPPSGLKRLAERWDPDDLPVPKRPRSGASLDELTRTISNPGSKEYRRSSIDFAPRSPPPTESIPGSAYPRFGSPGLSTRPSRTLPSPSSLAYPPSAAPSLAPPTAPSIGSPTTPCQPTVSIHTASASSATSQHIADLQHQVTLKSLSLQTLQSEYASLLQKLQRERVKSQTIEKKTTVADQEVNDLTGRNEDLAEQVKILETQLEECEKKRESESLTAATERDQWTKLLALDRQLQSKNAEEKQKLRQEKSKLSQRVAAYEDDNSTRSDQDKRSVSHTNATWRDTDKIDEMPNLTPAATTDGSSGDATNNVESLKNEVAALNIRIETLRSSLEEAKRRSQRLGEKTQEVVERNADIGDSIDRVLEDDNAVAKTTRNAQASALSARSTPTPLKSSWSPTTVPTAYPNSSRTLSQSPNPHDLSSTMQSASSSLSMASIARAVSPGPAELGFHVTPSSSSPEELIAALGPVPPPMQFTPVYPSGKRGANAVQRKKPRKRNTDNSTEGSKHGHNVQLNSFRPLLHPAPLSSNGAGRVVEYVDALNSYASSPGSMVESRTPSSSETSSRRSSEEEKTAANVVNFGHSTFTTSLHHAGSATDFHPISAMPPPPRPSMSLKDLCSIPAGPMIKP